LTRHNFSSQKAVLFVVAADWSWATHQVARNKREAKTKKMETKNSKCAAQTVELRRRKKREAGAM